MLPEHTWLRVLSVWYRWDGSRAAARAVGDAMPFLKKAKQVEIVIVADKPGKKDEIPGADLGPLGGDEASLDRERLDARGRDLRALDHSIVMFISRMIRP